MNDVHSAAGSPLIFMIAVHFFELIHLKVLDLFFSNTLCFPSDVKIVME